MITVYHSESMHDHFGNKEPIATDLNKVAVVNTTDLEEAFKLTNHIEEDWTLNEGVTPLVFRARSTSCGDVMVKDGKTYLVAMCGFKEVNLKLGE